MVFKTITDDSNAAKTSLTLFGEKWSDIKNDFNSNSANTKNVTKLLNVFKGFKKEPIISQEDVASLRQYNNLLTNGASQQAAMEQALASSSQAARDLAQQANGLTVSEKTLAAASQTVSIKSRLAAAGMKTLAIAGNMLVGIGIGFAVNFIVTQISKLVNASKEAKENLEGFNSSLSSSIEKLKEEEQTLNDLSEEYINIIATTSDLSSAKDELQSIQDNLINTYDKEAEGIDLVNGKISEQILAIQQLKKEKAEDWLGDNSQITDPTDNDKKLTNQAAAEYAKQRLKNKSVFDNFSTPMSGGASYTITGQEGIDYNKVGSKGYGDWKTYYSDVSKIIDKLDNVDINPDNGDDLFFTGTMEERLKSMETVYNELNKVWKNLGDSDVRKNWLSDMQSQITSLNLDIDLYKDTLEEYDKIQETLSNNDWSEKYSDKFSNVFSQALDSKDKLLNATSSNSKITALKELNNLKKTLYDLADGTEDGTADLAKADSMLISQLDTFFSTINKTYNLGNSELKNQISVFNDTLTTFSDDTFDDLSSKVDKFNNAISSIKNGESLSSSDVKDLIDIDGSLSGQFKQTIDGYTISLDELSSSRENFLKSTNDTINSEIKSTENYIQELKTREKELLLVNGAKSVFGSEFQEINKDIRNSTENIEKWTKLQELLNDLFDETEESTKSVDNIVSHFETQVDNIIDSLNEEKEAQEEILNTLKQQKEELEDIISNYEKVADIVTQYIDDNQIADLEDRKTAIEDYYNAQIEALQAENDERDRNIELQEKQAALDNAKKTKVRVYSETQGWHYESDTSSINSAQKDLDDYNNEIKIDNLEKQRDSETSAIDDEIKAWEDYKTQWQEQVGTITEADNMLLASKILGSDWLQKISEKDTGVLNTFGTEYANYQYKLNNDVDNEISSIENAISEKEKQISEWTNYKDSLSNWVSDITKINDDYKTQLDDVKISEQANLDERIEYLESHKDAIRNLWNEINSLEDIPSSANSIGGGIQNFASGIKGYANGGVSDKTGLSMLHGTSSKSEVIFSSAQAKQLYEMARNNEFPNVVANNIVDNISKNAKLLNNISSTNNKTVAPVTNIHFNNPVINAENYEQFSQYMDRYTGEAMRSSWVGK